MKKLFIYIFLVVFNLSCSFVEPENQFYTNFSNVTIKSGQSFGFCIGKCYSEMVVKGTEVQLNIKERTILMNNVQEKEYIYPETLSSQKVSVLSSLIDFNKFFDLKDSYGCPDCADGGSEWIEIITDKGKSKKVTFEYGGTVPEIENLIKYLRDEREALQVIYMK